MFDMRSIMLQMYLTTNICHLEGGNFIPPNGGDFFLRKSRQKFFPAAEKSLPGNGRQIHRMDPSLNDREQSTVLHLPCLFRQ
jgi:hypothetical protein